MVKFWHADPFFGHGTLNFCRVNAKLRVRGSKILSGPRPQEVVSARLKIGPRTENLLRTRFVSHIAKILCRYKQISRENVHGQTKPYIQELRYIVIVMHKEAIYSTGILATLKSKLTAKRRERELYLSSLSNMLIYVMVKIIVIS